MSEPKWVLREVLFDDGQPIAHREPHDWSMLEAAKESLREHMAEIHRLHEVNAELLGALKEVSEEVRHPDYDWSVDLALRVRAAIAKAEEKI